MHTHTHTHTHTLKYTCTHTCTHINVYIYIYIYTAHTHIHTYVPVRTIFAPGCTSGPFWTHFLILSILYLFTLSGNVIILATKTGTPTWSTRRLGSGDITVRAEKSTLFPDRFPRNLPCLPVKAKGRVHLICFIYFVCWWSWFLFDGRCWSSLNMMHAYTHDNTQTQKHTDVHTLTHIHIYICVYIIYLYKHMQIHTDVHTLTHIHIYICVYIIYLYKHMQIHTDVNTLTHS